MEFEALCGLFMTRFREETQGLFRQELWEQGENEQCLSNYTAVPLAPVKPQRGMHDCGNMNTFHGEMPPQLVLGLPKILDLDYKQLPCSPQLGAEDGKNPPGYFHSIGTLSRVGEERDDDALEGPRPESKVRTMCGQQVGKVLSCSNLPRS